MRSVPRDKQKGRTLRPGDLLIEKSGGGESQPVGTVVLYDHGEEAICSNFVARMPVADGHDAGYLTYLHQALYGLRVPERAIKQTTGIQNLDSDDYLNEKVALPPLQEQRAIAGSLDRRTAAIDALIAKKERLAQLLHEKRQAVISAAVTRGLRTGVPEKASGHPWLGSVPCHWDVSELRRVIRAGTSITYGIVQAGPQVEGGIPYIRTSDMAGDELPADGYAKTSPEIDAAYRRSKVVAGDVVVAIRATVGKPLIVPQALSGANLTQGTARIAPGPRLATSYLWFALRSTPCQQRFEALAKGATFREITLDMLRRFPIPVPPVQEQEEIASYLEREDARLLAASRRVEGSCEKLREYRQALIMAAVTGQLDVRQPEAA